MRPAGQFFNGLLELTGSRWLKDYWIDFRTREIVGIGPNLPSGYSHDNVQQVDMMYAKSGYQPVVGDILDPNQIDDHYDIKTSVRGRVSGRQLENFEEIFGPHKTKVGQSLRRWSLVDGWHDNETQGRRFKLIGIAIGVVTMATACVAWADESEMFYERIDPLLTAIKNEDDALERRLLAIQAIQEAKTYLAKFTPDSTLVDILSWVMMYKAAGVE